jgi:hypothetical protein
MRREGKSGCWYMTRHSNGLSCITVGFDVHDLPSDTKAMYPIRHLGYTTRLPKGKSCTPSGTWDTRPGCQKGSHVLHQAPGIHDSAVQEEVMYPIRSLGYIIRMLKEKSCTPSGSWGTRPGCQKGSHVLHVTPGIHDPAVQEEVMYPIRLLGYTTRLPKGKSCTPFGPWDT